MQQFAGAFAGRRCVVTGAGGFIGTSLCRRLRQEGAKVHALGRQREAPADLGEWTACDVTDLSQVRSVLQASRPQLIFHLASRVSGSQNVAMVLPTLQSNLVGFVNVALVARELECGAVVTIGSLMEPDQQIPAVPHSPYAAAKFAASCYARMFARIYGLPVSIARLMMVYGPGQLDLTKLVPYVISRLLDQQIAELSSGRQEFDWVYIDDVVDALLAMATRPDLAGATIDVGSGVLTSVADMSTGIASRLNGGHLLRLGALPDRKAEPTRVADVTRTRELLSWQARVNVETGLDRTTAWYSERRRTNPRAFTNP
jgi:nucleoside-diphosphate-sugar epimerase